MLLRRDDRGVLAIGQPSHAWISGQLARAWGNTQFGAPEPQEEVCLAADQHDIGMAAWDLAPSRDPRTGLPHSFMEMPLQVHLELWRGGPRRLLAQSRYAALLVSMHGFRLYARRNLDQLDPAGAEAVRAYLTEQRGFQESLLSSLRADPVTAPAAAAQLVARNSQLIWTWDFLSLALCLDWAPTRARQVPTAQGPVDLALEPSGAPRRLTLAPWPFAVPTVVLRCEGRRLYVPLPSEKELREALEEAPWETVELELTA